MSTCHLLAPINVPQSSRTGFGRDGKRVIGTKLVQQTRGLEIFSDWVQDVVERVALGKD